MSKNPENRLVGDVGGWHRHLAGVFFHWLEASATNFHWLEASAAFCRHTVFQVMLPGVLADTP